MRRKRAPGCPCCGVCTIDRLTPETEITEDTIRPKEHPQSPYSTWLQAEVKATSTSPVKLFLAWDSLDGLYVEFTPQDGATNGTLKLFRKDGTQLGTTKQLICADQDIWHRITICYDPLTDEFSACFDARDSRGFIVRGQCISEDVPADFVAGKQAGYGGEGYVRNYKYDRLWYRGDGTQQECCEVTIETIQDGQEYIAAVSPQWNWSFSLCSLFATFVIKIKGPNGEWYTNTYSYDGDPSTTLAFIVNDVNSYFGETFLSSSGNSLLGVGSYGYTMETTDVQSVSGCAILQTSSEGNPEQPALNETQTVTIGSRPCPFYLIFDGDMTAELSEESTASEVESALESLSGIGSGSVSVSGSAGGPFTVEFTGSLAATPLDAMTSASADPDCLECDDYYAPDYGVGCEPTICHHCGAPDCTVVSESFAGVPDGDMPCGWDADGTDWQVTSEKASGNGEICHEYDTTGGSYNVQAWFDLGHLETLGDSVTVSLTYGSATHSLTVTRVVGANPGDPERLKYDWVPSDFASTYGPLVDGSIILKICPYKICNNEVQTIVEEVVEPGPICVSITQPTMSGHEDAALTLLVVKQSKEMNDICPECECTTTCSDYCVDSVWPSGWLAEVEGVESFCCDADGINRAYYVTRYLSECHSYGFGDDGMGTATPVEVVEFIPGFGDHLVAVNPCFEGLGGGFGFNPIRGWFAKSGETDSSLIYSFPESHREPYPSLTYYTVRVDVAILEYAYFNPFATWRTWWNDIQPSPATANTTHAIVATVSRLVYRRGIASPTASTLVFAKKYSEVTDCQNLTDEVLPFVQYLEPANTVTSWQYITGSRTFGNCSHYAPYTPPSLSSGNAFFWGLGVNPYATTGLWGSLDTREGWSQSTLRLTAL